MPIFSLPSPYGIGTLGKAAYDFVDFLCAAGCRIWQVLPIEPTSFGNSPYSACASGVFNPYFIDFDLLRTDGLLTVGDYYALDWGDDPCRVDYGKMYSQRNKVLYKAFERFNRNDEAWRLFTNEEKYRDFAVFMALKNYFGGKPCDEWLGYSEYEEATVANFEKEHAEEIAFWQFTQYVFLKQWTQLKAYANERGVEIMGDMPIYVARDSVEMWKHKRELFLLDGNGELAGQAGVPPDAFSAEGQLWGNPVYDWEKMRTSDYSWWHSRIRSALGVYDILRIDHFIGFVRFYCIPIGASTAKIGKWRKGPGAKLFENFSGAPIVAEDLGLVTDRVRKELERTGYAGRKILQHAFDGNPANEHKPSNYIENCVAYTGTHDNETLYSVVAAKKGAERKTCLSDLKSECRRAGVAFTGGSNKKICESILKLLYASKAKTVIVPFQDVLLMGQNGRINAPSTVSDTNWSVRFVAEDFSEDVKTRLRDYASEYGRV